MDQVVRTIIFPEVYPPSQFETGAGSLSKNKSDDQKYLPKAAEHTGNDFEHKGFSSRCISLVSAENDNDDYYINLAKNIVSTVDPIFQDSIDEESWRNMADSLKFSGVNSLEKAIAMNLRVCPPCPVFHTWAALHGTSIFNGLNTPQKFNGINYTQRILEEGTELGKNDVPLFIVFSDMNLTKSQIDEMKG